MNIDPSALLQSVTLGIAGWTLLRVIKYGEVLAAMNQKLKDLPCGDCKVKT